MSEAWAVFHPLQIFRGFWGGERSPCSPPAGDATVYK